MTEETDKTYRLRQRRPQHIFSVSRSKHVAFEGDRLVHADNPEHAAWRVIFASAFRLRAVSLASFLRPVY